MLLRPDERAPIARLLDFLAQGEELAHEGAVAQSFLAPDSGMRRFLLGQARQERAHALVFRSAIAWLAPRHREDRPLLAPLTQYRMLLEDTIRREEWLESVLAEQVILEGLGQAVLHRIEAGLCKRHAPFSQLRRVLLHQEEAHHGFGRRVLERALATNETTPEALRMKAEPYLALARALMITLADVFDVIDEDPAAYVSDFHRTLPTWLAVHARRETGDVRGETPQ